MPLGLLIEKNCNCDVNFSSNWIRQIRYFTCPMQTKNLEMLKRFLETSRLRVHITIIA